MLLSKLLSTFLVLFTCAILFSCNRNKVIKKEILKVEENINHGKFSVVDETFLLELVNKNIKEDSLRNTVYYNLARGYSLKEDYEKAFVFCFKSFETGINTHHSSNVIGYIYSQQNKFQESNEWYKKSLLIKPDYVYALGNLSFNQIFNKNFEDARLTLEKAVNFSPYNFTIINNLGYCYMMLNEYNLADSCLQRAIKLEPENDLVILNKAQLLLSTKGPDYADKYLELHRDLIDNVIYSNYIRYLIITESDNLSETCNAYSKLNIKELKDSYNIEVTNVYCTQLGRK